MDCFARFAFPSLAPLHALVLGRTLTAMTTPLVAACNAQALLPPVMFETEHFRYHASPEAGICDGLGGWLEHHYSSVGGEIDARLPRDQKFDIYLLANAEDLKAAGCGALGFEASGCTDRQTIYQLDPVEPHELVHAYANTLGSAPPFFAEGLAQVFGCAGQAPSDLITPSRSAAFSGLTESDFSSLSDDERDASYAAAAGLVRFLVDRDGVDRFMTFYSALGRHASETRIADAFEATYGSTLDKAVDDWTAGPPRTLRALCKRVAECTTPALETSGRSAPLRPVCSYGESPLGLLSHAAIRHLPAETEVEARIQMTSTKGVIGVVDGCQTTLEPTPTVLTRSGDEPTGTELWAHLEAGDYWLMVGADDDSFSAAVEASVSALDCEAASPKLVGAQTTTLDLVRSVPRQEGRASGVRYVKFEMEEARYATFFGLGATYELCAGGCPGDADVNCRSQAVGVALEADTVYTLALDGPYSIQVKLDDARDE